MYIQEPEHTELKSLINNLLEWCLNNTNTDHENTIFQDLIDYNFLMNIQNAEPHLIKLQPLIWLLVQNYSDCIRNRSLAFAAELAKTINLICTKHFGYYIDINAPIQVANITSENVLSATKRLNDKFGTNDPNKSQYINSLVPLFQFMDNNKIVFSNDVFLLFCEHRDNFVLMMGVYSIILNNIEQTENEAIKNVFLSHFNVVTLKAMFEIINHFYLLENYTPTEDVVWSLFQLLIQREFVWSTLRYCDNESNYAFYRACIQSKKNSVGNNDNKFWNTEGEPSSHKNDNPYKRQKIN